MSPAHIELEQTPRGGILIPAEVTNADLAAMIQALSRDVSEIKATIGKSPDAAMGTPGDGLKASLSGIHARLAEVEDDVASLKAERLREEERRGKLLDKLALPVVTSVITAMLLGLGALAWNRLSAPPPAPAPAAIVRTP